MKIRIKKHANLIEKNGDIFLTLDSYLISGTSKIEKILKHAFCLEKSIKDITLINKKYQISFISPFQDLKNQLIIFLESKFTIENSNKNTILIKQTDISNLKKELKNFNFETEKVEFKLNLNYTENAFLEISINHNRLFNTRHKGFKKILTLKKYHKLLNVFKVSILINNLYSNKNNCSSLFYKNESIFLFYFKFLDNVLEEI